MKLYSPLTQPDNKFPYGEDARMRRRNGHSVVVSARCVSERSWSFSVFTRRGQDVLEAVIFIVQRRFLFFSVIRDESMRLSKRYLLTFVTLV